MSTKPTATGAAATGSTRPVLRDDDRSEQRTVFAFTALSAAVTLLLTGAVAGVFFAYSTSVMIGLDAVRPEHAIGAMRSINEKIQNPVFLTSFTFAPLAALTTGALLLVLGRHWSGVVFLLAAAAYLLGAVLPTAAVNVPMNNALAAVATPVDPHEAARLWAEYSTRWTRWNGVRAGSSLLSMLLVGLGLFLWGRSST